MSSVWSGAIGTCLYVFIGACISSPSNQEKRYWGSSYPSDILQAVKQWFQVNILSMAWQAQNDPTPCLLSPAILCTLLVFTPQGLWIWLVFPRHHHGFLFVTEVSAQMSPPLYNFLWEPTLKHLPMLFSSHRVALCEMILYIHLCNDCLVLPAKCIEILSSLFTL